MKWLCSIVYFAILAWILLKFTKAHLFFTAPNYVVYVLVLHAMATSMDDDKLDCKSRPHGYEGFFVITLNCQINSSIYKSSVSVK